MTEVLLNIDTILEKSKHSSSLPHPPLLPRCDLERSSCSWCISFLNKKCKKKGRLYCDRSSSRKRNKWRRNLSGNNKNRSKSQRKVIFLVNSHILPITTSPFISISYIQQLVSYMRPFLKNSIVWCSYLDCCDNDMQNKLKSSTPNLSLDLKYSVFFIFFNSVFFQTH